MLLLPDMDIDIPTKALINLIINLFGQANIPDAKFKQNAYFCLIRLIKRFYTDNELKEMIKMLQIVTKDPKVARILEEYGPGFDEIYYDGKEDGFADGRTKGFNDANLQIARKCLARGVDEEIISDCTGVSIQKLQELKRKL